LSTAHILDGEGKTSKYRRGGQGGVSETREKQAKNGAKKGLTETDVGLIDGFGNKEKKKEGSFRCRKGTRV